MWRCLNCKEFIKDQFAFCWKCGTRAPKTPRSKDDTAKGVPSFGSYEELAPDYKQLAKRGHAKLVPGWLAISALISFGLILNLVQNVWLKITLLSVPVAILVIWLKERD